MAFEYGDWIWPWVLAHAGVWAIVMARVLGLCLDGAGAGDTRIGLAFASGAGLGARCRVDPGARPVDRPSIGRGERGRGLGIGDSHRRHPWLVGRAHHRRGRMAGELVAAQAGLATAALFDPESGAEITALGRLYGWVALAVFLALDGPLVLVGALVESYQAVPAGRLLISPDTATLAFAQVGRALEAGAPSRRTRCPGVVLGGNRAGLAEPRGFVASLRHAGVADSQCPGCRADLAQPGHALHDTFRGMGHASLEAVSPATDDL